MATLAWHDGLFLPEDYGYDGLPEDAGIYSDDIEHAYFDGFVAASIEKAGLDAEKYRSERRRTHEAAIDAGHLAGDESYVSSVKNYMETCLDDEYEVYLAATADGRHAFNAIISNHSSGLSDHTWMDIFLDNVIGTISPDRWPPKRVCSNHTSLIPEGVTFEPTCRDDCEVCRFDELLATSSLPGSPVQFCLARAWLQSCDNSHLRECSAQETELKAPTRLIDVQFSDTNVLRLHCPASNEKPKYAALSHCWGQAKAEDKRPFCTTIENYNSRKQGFTVAELPKTFQDAVFVARQLDIPYLWVDSLCIIQGSQSDWRREAELMEGVYQSSYCTIAATCAPSSDAGFLPNAVFGHDEEEKSIMKQTQNPSFFQDFLKQIDNAPLSQRAWVLQERILSRRTLHFCANGLFFECGMGVYSSQESSTKNHNFMGEHYFTSDARFPKKLLNAGNKRTLEFIHAL